MGTWTTLGRVVTGLPRFVRGWCSEVKVEIRVRFQNLSENFRYLVIKAALVGYDIDSSEKLIGEKVLKNQL